MMPSGKSVCKLIWQRERLAVDSIANSAQKSRNSDGFLLNYDIHHTHISRRYSRFEGSEQCFTLVEKDGVVLLFIPFLVRPPADSHDSCSGCYCFVPGRGAAFQTACTAAQCASTFYSMIHCNKSGFTMFDFHSQVTLEHRKSHIYPFLH